MTKCQRRGAQLKGGRLNCSRRRIFIKPAAHTSHGNNEGAMNQSQNTSRTLNYKAYHFIGYFKNGIQLIQRAALEMIIFPLNCDASNNSNSSSAPLHFSLLYLQVLSSPPPPPLPVGARIIDRPVTAQRRGTLSLFQLERTNRGRQSEEGRLSGEV